MSIADFINGCFEMLSGLMLFLNCRRLYIDKEVRGLSIYATIFFTLWSFWNLYYYPSLNQWLSFFGGMSIVTANTIYVVMAIYYIRKGKQLS